MDVIGAILSEPHVVVTMISLSLIIIIIIACQASSSSEINALVSIEYPYNFI